MRTALLLHWHLPRWYSVNEASVSCQQTLLWPVYALVKEEHYFAGGLKSSSPSFSSISNLFQIIVFASGGWIDGRKKWYQSDGWIILVSSSGSRDWTCQWLSCDITTPMEGSCLSLSRSIPISPTQLFKVQHVSEVRSHQSHFLFYTHTHAHTNFMRDCLALWLVWCTLRQENGQLNHNTRLKITWFFLEVLFA